jgi:hypothetical protein
MRPVRATVVGVGLGRATPHGPAPNRGPVYSQKEECMSFVTTLPEALAAAAAKLEGIGSGMAAQNAAAAAPTTAIAPAAADEVSALQATQFTAFGNLYQSVSAQAQAIHQQLVNGLGTSAGSYGATEAANQAAAASTPLSGILGSLSTSGTSGGALTFGINGVQNFTAAASDLISTASIGTLPGYGAPAAGGSVAGATSLAGDVSASGAAGPAGSAALGGRRSRPGGHHDTCHAGRRRLDQRPARRRSGEHRAGRDASGGHGRQSRRPGRTALRREAHRDAQTISRIEQFEFSSAAHSSAS